jgi:hypothetical protein
VNVIVSNNTPRKMARFKPILVRIVRKAAQDMVGHMIDAMSGPKSGRTYRRTSIKGATSKRAQAAAGELGLRRARLKDRAGRKRFVVGYVFHRASAPGEAPARDSANLASTISQIEERENGLTQIIPLTDYALILEPTRPFIKPATDFVLPAMRQAIQLVSKTL